MSTIEAIILGIIQGLTEFLPVSSSGHLQLGQHFLGLSNLNEYIIFDLICHLGTLLAIFFIFWKDILLNIKSKTSLKRLFVAILPLFPLLLILKPIKSLFNELQYLGFFFLITAFLLFLGMRFSSQQAPEKLKNRKWRDPFIIGMFQACAILPGVSRSGATISSARLLGWNTHDAISFSFLLAIPTILGGTLLELITLFRKPNELSIPSISWEQYLAGFLTSLIVGYFALILLQKLAAKQKFMYFVWYCTILGIGTIIYFNFINSR